MAFSKKTLNERYQHKICFKVQVLRIDSYKRSTHWDDYKITDTHRFES